ncbi:HNH endonuclease [Bacillus gobiensis]|uniref:HNH endonuclease n=1 Tax=Bacillus gobiensis TaxID=1441095 RepID=UPI003D199A3F
MLRSCSYCGNIHDRKYQCPKKPKRKKNTTHIDKFRWSTQWQKKRKQIREDRDRHMCQVCIRELHNTEKKYNFNNIQVHHVYSVSEAWDKRLDDNNLISLCSYHHGLAEYGKISKKELLKIVDEQEEKSEI